MDEEIYEKLFESKIPFTKTLLHLLAHEHEVAKAGWKSDKGFHNYHYGAHFADRALKRLEANHKNGLALFVLFLY